MSTILPDDTTGWRCHSIRRNSFVIQRSSVSLHFERVINDLWQVDKYKGGKVLEGSLLRLADDYIDKLKELC